MRKIVNWTLRPTFPAKCTPLYYARWPLCLQNTWTSAIYRWGRLLTTFHTEGTIGAYFTNQIIQWWLLSFHLFQSSSKASEQSLNIYTLNMYLDSSEYPPCICTWVILNIYLKYVLEWSWIFTLDMYLSSSRYLPWICTWVILNIYLRYVLG